MLELVAILALGALGLTLVVWQQRREDADSPATKRSRMAARQEQSLVFAKTQTVAVTLLTLFLLVAQQYAAALVLAALTALSLGLVFYLRRLIVRS